MNKDTSLTPVPAPPPRELALDDANQAAFGAAPSGGLLEYWRIMQRRKATVIVVSCLGLLAGILWTLPQTPIYQARALIEIQSMNEDFMYSREVNPTASSGYVDPQYDIQTQIRVLQSRALLDRVIAKLGLEKKDLSTNPTRLDAWRKALKLAPAQAPSRNSVIRDAAGGLKVTAQENTRLIEISSDSANPKMAADFVNTLTSEYIEQNLEARWKTAQFTGEWLTRQMEDLRVKLEKAEEAMQAYASQTGLVFTGASNATGQSNNVAEDRVKQLQDQLSQAQGARIAAQSRYDLASRVPVETLAEVAGDGNMQAIQGRLVDLRAQLAQLTTTLTPENPKVVKVREQISTLDSALKQAREIVLKRIQNDYEAAKQREDLLAAGYSAAALTVSEQADQVAHYNILKREVDTTRQIYDAMLQRVKEAGVASALRASNVRVVDPAEVPAGPYKPSLPRNAAVGLLSGIFGGILFVVFLDRADRSIQEPGDAAFYLGIPELGVVPSAAADPHYTRALLPLAGQRAAAPESLALVARERARSAIAESIRTVLTSIMFAGPERPRVILISSAAPAEGKSTLATNLAIALAEIDRRVLLIDGDLRRPNLHRAFDLKNESGLADVLRARNPLDGPLNGLAQPTEIPSLSILPAGPSHVGNPALLYSDRLRRILELAREEYDAVIVDTPPMLTMADARVIARYADGVVLVARVNRTSRQALRDACQRFIDDGANVFGAVLNDWNPKKSSRYGYYRYYEKYKHYYHAEE